MPEVSSIPILKVVNGKDCMRLLTIQFRALGASDLVDVAPLLWTSFRCDKLSEFPVLSEIVVFLAKA